MTSEELTVAGLMLYGRKGWKVKLARDLGINHSTVHRMLVSGKIPGPVAAAVKGWLGERAARLKRRPAKPTPDNQGVKP